MESINKPSILILFISLLSLSFISIWHTDELYPNWYGTEGMMDPYNPHRGWSYQDYVDCGTTRATNNNTRIPSQVFYNRFVIDSLIDMSCLPDGPAGEEICSCAINTDHIDEMISRAESKGQKLTFRVYFYGLFRTETQRLYFNADSYKLEKCGYSGLLGAKWNRTTLEFGPAEWVPDLQANDMKDFHAELMDSLKQYDGHPSIDFIEVGSVGHYGEWHAAGLWTDTSGDGVLNKPDDYHMNADQLAYEDPDLPFSGWVLEDYFDTFIETPLIMQIGGNWERIRYRFDHVWEDIGRKDFGIRGDGFGDSGNPGSYHFEESYSHEVYDSVFKYRHPADGNLRYINQWQRGPILFEVGFYGYRNWLQYEKAQVPYDYNYLEEVIQQAKDYHLSILNQKNSHIAGFNCEGNPYYNDEKWLTDFGFSETQLDVAKTRIEETLPSFLHGLGYKIKIEEFDVPPYMILPGHVPSSCMSEKIRVEWNNVGVAPCYYNYYWTLKILQPGEIDICSEGQLYTSETSIQGVLPDFEEPEIAVYPPSQSSISFNPTLVNEGRYQVYIGLMRAGDSEPRIRLSNDDMSPNANCLWYHLGDIDVNSSGDMVLESPPAVLNDKQYLTNGFIYSSQIIGDPSLPKTASENMIEVKYNAGATKGISLWPGFEIASGVSFQSFLEWCEE